MQKTFPKTPLSFEEIVIRADLDVIKAALEARQKIDDLLAERQEAYRRIAELENQVETILGQPGVFVFPAPPVSVASVPKTAPAKPVKVASPQPEPAPAKPEKK